MNTFGLIIDPPRAAAANMAADLALMQQAAAEQRPFLRFYCWERPTISLGQAQNFSELFDAELLAREGIDWIVRPTGGRAVFHVEDLTYAFCFPLAFPGLGRNVAETYAVLAECFRAGFSRAGIAVGLEEVGRSGVQLRSEQKLPCFISSGRHEVLSAGKKLVGSAQKRTHEAVLQHGSIPFSPRFRELPRYQRIAPAEQDAQMAELGCKCACIQELSPGLSPDTLLHSLVQGFADHLGLQADLFS